MWHCVALHEKEFEKLSLVFGESYIFGSKLLRGILYFFARTYRIHLKEMCTEQVHHVR